MDPARRLVTVYQACAIAGVKRRTVYAWIAARRVDWVRTAGGEIRIVAVTLFRDGNVPAVAALEPTPLPPFPIGPLVPPGARLPGGDR
jgi:excisionase family DNA binding protein